MRIWSNIYKQDIETELDFIFEHSILKNQLWEKFICDTIFLNYVPDTDIIDVGANIGLITLGTLLVADFYKININQIHCFECNYHNFAKLAFNTQNKSAVALYNMGLGDTTKLATMTFNKHNNGASFISQIVDASAGVVNHLPEIFTKPEFSAAFISEKIYINIVPLDSIMHQFTTPVSVVKVDIEGYEYEFLVGARAFLAQHRPALIIEIMPEYQEKIVALLTEYKYYMAAKLDYHNWLYKPQQPPTAPTTEDYAPS